MSALRLDWAVVSDTGQVRANNQDSAVAEPGIFAVADGMGGHAAGEVASQVAIDSLREWDSGSGLAEAVRAANRAIIDRAAGDPSLRGMGTTVCALALVDDRAVVVNVGDSRAYVFRDGDLLQLTEDHNLVAELERDGRISAEEARVHPQRNIITRVLGNDFDVDVDEFTVDPLRGDRFLLCSDGLFNEVDDETIAAVLRTEAAPQGAADELVRLANERGGRDNVTVVLVDVLADGEPARAASAALAGAAATGNRDASRRPEPERTDDRPAEAPSDAPSEERSEVVTGDETRHPRRLTWRSALFALALLLIGVAVAGSLWWFGRNLYFVGEDDGEITIFRGRPGGVLWIHPTVERSTGVDLDEVPPANRTDIEDGREYAELDDAEAYVDRLHRQWRAQQRPTTTTTTTTTPSSPTTLATTTTAP